MPTIIAEMTRGAVFNYLVEMGGLGAAAPTAKTLSADRLTLDTNVAVYTVAAESGTTDDIDGISGFNESQFLLLRADIGDTITLKDENAGAAAATDRIRLPGGTDVAFGDDEAVFFYHDDTLDRWVLISGPVAAGHAEDHDHDGAPTQQLLAVNTHGSPSATTHHSNADDHAEAHAPESHIGQGATAAELETLTDASDADALHAHSNHGVTHNAAHGISKHTAHANWKALYTDGAGDEQELALGADNTFLRSAGPAAAPVFETLYSVHTYTFVPDAAFDADIATGDEQGIILHSGDNAETVVDWGIDARTAPTGAALKIQLEYGDTDDLDTVASWTEIDVDDLPVGTKSITFTAGLTNTALPANRLVRMNVDQVGSTVAGQNANVWMKVKRPLVT